MRTEKFFEILGQMDDAYVKSARQGRKSGKRWAAVAACLAVLAAIGIWMLHDRQNMLPLSDGSQGVTVKYTSKVPAVTAIHSLIDLTEEELFTYFDTAIFRGTVMSIDNIVLSFQGEKSYRAIAEIQVEQVYRGDCQAGDTLHVLLPCPIADGVWVEDSDTIAAMRVGMTGIFMPIVYQDTDYWKQNGATLLLKDIADYGFADGARYAFLETADGLVFSRSAYESIAGAQTLEQVAEYVVRMLDIVGRE